MMMMMMMMMMLMMMLMMMMNFLYWCSACILCHSVKFSFDFLPTGCFVCRHTLFFLVQTG
jgi:hypothetical protein